MNAKKRLTYSLKIRLRSKEINTLQYGYNFIQILLNIYFQAYFQFRNEALLLLSQLPWLLSDQGILKIHLTTLAILVFHSTASVTIRCRQHLLFFTCGTSERRQSANKGRGQSCDPTLHRELSHFSSTHISGMLATHLQNFSQLWNFITHRSKQQRWKCLGTAYKLLFGTKLCLHPLNSASAT